MKLAGVIIIGLSIGLGILANVFLSALAETGPFVVMLTVQVQILIVLAIFVGIVLLAAGNIVEAIRKRSTPD